MLIIDEMQDNHVWTSKYAQIESMTMKIKVKNVNDLDENW